MRSGVGNHSHREALRRMQAKADVGAGSSSPSAGPATAAGVNGSDGLVSPGARRRSSSVAKPPAPGMSARRGSSVTRWAGAAGAGAGAAAGGPPTMMMRRRDSDLNRIGSGGGGSGWENGRTTGY
jgi:hypothetical protein